MCFFKKEIDISVEQEPQNTITLETDGGVSDYNLLSNKPKINGVTVENERDGNDYGLVNQSDLEGYVKKNESTTLNEGDGYTLTFANGSEAASISLGRTGDFEIKTVEGTGTIKISAEYNVIINNTILSPSLSGNQFEVAGDGVYLRGPVDINGSSAVTTATKASDDAFGVVKVDGTTITANNGVISAVGGGGGAPTLTWYTGATGTTVTVSDTTGATLVKVYKNGLLLQPTEDYTISGTTLTLVTALVATDKITTEVF